MLVLSRRTDESILIGDPSSDQCVVITIVRDGANRVSLGISTGDNSPIVRDELFKGGLCAEHVLKHMLKVNDYDVAKVLRWAKGDHYGDGQGRGLEAEGHGPGDVESLRREMGS